MHMDCASARTDVAGQPPGGVRLAGVPAMSTEASPIRSVPSSARSGSLTVGSPKPVSQIKQFGEGRKHSPPPSFGRTNRCSSSLHTLVQVSVNFQPSLLDEGSSFSLSPILPADGRTHLANDAWIELHRDWVRGSDKLFERLMETVSWKAERRRMYERTLDVPRLVSFFGTDEPLPDPALDTIRKALNTEYRCELGEPFCTVGLCLYRDGRDSVAWHGDRIGIRGTKDTTVAIVSLGTPRRFLLRPRGGGRSLQFELGRGDLFIMGGSCQRTWEHSVPKVARANGPRMSVQFRPAGVR
jgi:alkylated DNA repair dioxygenase AlkB